MTNFEFVNFNMDGLIPPPPPSTCHTFDLGPSPLCVDLETFRHYNASCLDARTTDTYNQSIINYLSLQQETEVT